MSIYSFSIKKGKYQLELTTTDRELLADQLELWINNASDYAKKKKASEHRNIVNSQIKAEEEITKKNIEKHTKISTPEEVPAVDAPVAVSSEKSEPSGESLNVFYVNPITKKPTNETVVEYPKAGVFDRILEKSMQNPAEELSFKPTPTIKKDSAFLNYITAKKIERKIDYLLYTAYYLTQYEQRPRFTLKQLNTKLMQNIAVIIDHSVLQEAINRDYIECLPDLTGLVGASEYRLTAYGEKFLLDE